MRWSEPRRRSLVLVRPMKRTLLILVLVPSIVVAKRAPDKPVLSHDKKSNEAIMKAEASYIAKGRATYPAAKKRYLAGLPRGYSFEVRKRLADPGGTAFEEVFIMVDAIKNGRIYGRIGNELGAVRSYRRLQRISFPESEVLDWTIVHPDGREEGELCREVYRHL